MIDIDSIEEEHYEKFICLCQDDIDYDNRIFENFADPVEQFRKWKMDDHDQEQVYQRAFDEMYLVCAEEFVWDMKGFLKNFLAHKETVAEFRREWEHQNGK